MSRMLNRRNLAISVMASSNLSGLCLTATHQWKAFYTLAGHEPRRAAHISIVAGAHKCSPHTAQASTLKLLLRWFYHLLLFSNSKTMYQTRSTRPLQHTGMLPALRPLLCRCTSALEIAMMSALQVGRGLCQCVSQRDSRFLTFAGPWQSTFHGVSRAVHRRSSPYEAVAARPCRSHSQIASLLGTPHSLGHTMNPKQHMFREGKLSIVS